MATEMELTQVSQMLAWLEVERKKDKAALATLEERLQGLLNESQQQARRIQELDATLASTKTLLARFTQVDRVLDEYKAEAKAVLDRRDEERKKAEREAARLRAVEIEEMNRAIAEIKKELPRLNRLDEEMSARRAEEKRLGDMARQVTLQVDSAMKQVEERTRGIPYLEEGRRQDTKRIAQLEADSLEHGKRLESLTARLQLLEEALGKTALKFDPVYERLGTQDKTIEEIRVLEFRRQQQMKAWEEELVKFRAQMTDYGDTMNRLREQAQTNQKAAADLAAFQETLRQRAAEIAEVERLFEERIKRLLEQSQAEDEKRWQRFTLRSDERWQDHDRQNDQHLRRTEALEAHNNPMQAAIDDLRRKHEELIHHLVEFGTSLAESRKSTLPNVSVPPASSPEDGRGIPDSNRRKRR